MGEADTTTRPRPRLAYLTGQYPMISHTFILREVEALRALGADVTTCTIRETRAADRPGPAEKEAHATTFIVQKAAFNPLRLARDHLGALTRRPRRYLEALLLALKTRPPGLRAFAYQLFYFAEAGALAAHLRRNEIDHLHNHFGNSSCSVAMLASVIAGIPFSYTMHGPSIFFEPKTWRIDEKIARARFVACISHFCRSQGMLFSDPDHWDRLKIVHCGVDPARYAPGPSRGEKGPQVLFVGRLAAVKGVRVLIDAFARLASDHPTARLTLVGDGPDRAALELAVAKAGLTEQIEFTGYLSQDAVAETLANADIFALPSFAEGVPVALMEAMASQIPVLAPRVGGVAELVEDGVHGFVLPPGDVDALASALDNLLSDPGLRLKMGAEGRAKVESEFTQSSEAKWLLRLFECAHSGSLPDAVRPGDARPTR